MERHTKIIATLGPACDDEIMLRKMAERGLNKARINCSHGTKAQHQKFIDTVRSMNKKYNHSVGILIDLTGYRIRVKNLKKNKILENDSIVYMSKEDEIDDKHIPFDYEEDLKTIAKGSYVFIDDGRLQLRVTDNSGKKLKCKVLQGGVLKEKKGINFPKLKLSSNIMTDQDAEDLQFAIDNKVEVIAQSFVRNKKDIARVADIMRPKLPDCKLIAKIESVEGVKNIESILSACDGVMVARGDLGVILPLYKVPLVQKYLIHSCNRQKKLSITATQMLESMVTNGRPTRAEVSDVANAILDGSDYIMLSGETSVGKYPSRSVQTMLQIIEYTEKYSRFRLSL